MAQYFWQTQMSKTPNALDYLKKKEQEKKKFNLFDFSDVKPTLNFGAPMSWPWITNFQDYKANLPQTTQTQPTQQSGFSLFPTANAMGESKTPQYNPNKWRWATNLFINERQALENMVNSWIDEEQALKAITEKRKELWGNTQLSQQESNALIQMAKADVDINQAIKAVKEKRYDDATILQKIGKNVLDLAAAWPALMAEQIANVWSFIFNDDELKQQAEAIRKIRKEDFESTIWGKTWSFVTWLWETLAVWPTKLAPTLLWRTAQWAMVWWITWAWMPVLEKWKDATMWDIATWWVVWWTIWAVATPLLEKVAIPAVAWVASKTMKYWKAWYYGWIEWAKKSVWRDIQRWIIKPFQKSAQDKAWNIALWWLINPAKLDAVKKWLMVDEWVATPQDVWKWMLDRIKPWNKQEIAEQLIKHSDTSKKAVDDALAKIPDTFENQTAKKALTQILNDLEWRVWFEDDAVRIAKLLNKDKYTLTELNWIKREMDKIYNIYKQSWEVSAYLNAQWLNKVRQEIRKFIEEQGKKYWLDIRKLNNETSVARWLAEWIMKKDNADNVREFLSAFAPTWVWSVIWAWQSIAQGNDPLVVLRDALIWWATAKILTSTKIRTLIADRLNKLWPKEMSALEKYIKSWWADEVWRKVAEKIVPQKLLPPWRWPNKAIITPQTVEKGIIQESKLPLKNTKYVNNNINSSSSNNSSVLLKPSILSDREKKLLKPNQPTNKPVPKDMPIETDAFITNAIETWKWSNLKNTFKWNEDIADYIDNLIENSNWKTSKEIWEKVQRVIYNKWINLSTLDAEHIWKYIGEFMNWKTNKKLWDIIRWKWPDEPPALWWTKLKPKDKPTPTHSVTKPKILKPNQPTNVSNKTIKKTSETWWEVLKTDKIKEYKETIWNWKPINWWYKVENIDITKTNAFPRAKYHREEYVNTQWYKYWKEQIWKWKEITPIVVEKTDKWYYVLDWYHRLAAAEDMWVKNIKSIVIDNPIKKWEQAKWLKQFTTFTDKEIQDIANTQSKKSILKKVLPSNFKEKAQDIVENLAEKTWWKKSFMWNEWIWADKLKQVSKVSDDLISEAKKYKSAEEFIKAQWDIVYHGSNSIGKHGVPWWVIKEWKVWIPTMRSDKSAGIYFWNKVVWERYARDWKWILYEARLWIKNPKEFPATVEWYMKFWTLDQEDVKQMIKEWYDWAHINASWKDDKWWSNDEWFAIYPERIKTDAQLKQIYEQAQKSKPLKKAK